MFEEIEKEKQELPAHHTVTSEIVGKRKLNFYQIIAIVVLILGFISGIILGNLIPACSQTSGIFGSCTKTEFNLSITLLSWASTFLLVLFIYAIGHIIAILESIDQKLK